MNGVYFTPSGLELGRPFQSSSSSTDPSRVQLWKTTTFNARPERRQQMKLTSRTRLCLQLSFLAICGAIAFSQSGNLRDSLEACNSGRKACELSTPGSEAPDKAAFVATMPGSPGASDLNKNLAACNQGWEN